MQKIMFSSIEDKLLKFRLNKYLVLLFLLNCFYISAFSQDKQSQQNIQTGVSYSISDVENINMTNGNLMFNFDFGKVQGRGAANIGFGLKYNSKLYETHTMSDLDYSGNMIPQKFLRKSNESGWLYDDSYSVRVISKNDELDQPLQFGGGCTRPTYDAAFLWKLMVYYPDGSQHEFRPLGYSDFVYNQNGTAIFNGDGYFNVAPSGVQLNMSYTTQTSFACNLGIDYTPYVWTSQHPNPKMVYYSTDGTYTRLEIPVGQNARYPNKWTLFFPDGSSVINDTDNQNNVLPQKIYDKNGNFIQQGAVTLPDGSVGGGWIDNLGRYLVRRNNVFPDEDHIYKMGYDGQLLTWKIKWKKITVIRPYTTSSTSGGIGRSGTSNQVLRTVIKVVDEIILPSQLGDLKYKFTYNAHDGQVSYTPNSPNYSNGWGEISSITLPSQSKAEYEYATENPEEDRAEQLLSVLGKVTAKKLKYETEYDGSTTPVTETSSYGINESGTTYITNPDGSTLTQYFYSTKVDNELSGRVYKEIMPDGSITEKLWANNKVGGCPQYGCGSMRRLNTFVKTEYSTVSDSNGNPTLTAIKDYNYDKNGNVTKVTEYDWVSYASIPRDSAGRVAGIPSGASIKRITENNYYNQTEDSTNGTANNSDAYWNTTSPNVRNAVSSTYVKNGSNVVSAHSEFYYDDVDNKANIIQSKSWDSYKNGSFQADSAPLTSTNSISTSIAYDQYGNPTLTTDAKGNQTQITYGNITTPNGIVTGLYPTQAVSAYGTAIAQTVQTTYDFYTGLPKTVTTLGNTTAENVTSETEYDALGRPIKTKAAIGTPLEIWSTTEYDDVARRIITRDDIETKGDGKKIAIQHFDQLGRVRLARSIENVASENPYNEADGIKVQTRYQTGNPYSYQLTSNPYRAATSTAATNEPSMGWTRSKSVNTGKHSETETFTGAALPAPWGNNNASTGVVTSDIDADRTLVTDQAGKRRISKTNALGQLVNVWEVKEADADTEAVNFTISGSGALSLNALKTSYQYDSLSNLITVNQGVQTRTFAYSSLSRLITANNPESGLISYVYDENGNLTKKTDARNVKTNYVYDALNRVTDRSYQDESPLQRATFPVKYIYDSNNIANSKGKLTKVITGNVNSPFAVTEYQEFDLMGRVKKSQQTTDGTAYNPMEYSYNLSGALIEQKYPSGRVVKNTLDNDGDLAIVQSRRDQNAGFVAYAKHFTYTAAGAVSSMQLGNGAWESTVFNSRLQPTQIALGSVQNGTNKLKLDFIYNTMTNGTPNADNNGNVLSQTITTPSETRGSTTYSAFTAVQTYQYDSLNRIKEAEEKIGSSQQWKQTFIYDRYGNRTFDEGSVSGQYKTTTLPRNCGTAPNLTVCAKDNPQAIAASNKLQGIEYDSAGNTKTDLDNRRFTYDGENKQIKVETTDGSGNVTGTLGEYFYDGDGKRVKKVSLENSQWITTIFVYDASGKMVAEYSTQSSTTPQVSYLTTDHLGSPRVNTDAIGNVTARHDYQPFGEEVQRASHGTDQVRQKFTSYERDEETELDFAQARYFNSSFGRFSTPDPYGGSGFVNIPQSWNRYIYCLNRPLVFTDPSGMIWLTQDDKNYIWVSDKEFEKGDYSKYRVADGAVINLGSTSGFGNKYNSLYGSAVSLNADGTLSAAAEPAFVEVSMGDDPDELLSTGDLVAMMGAIKSGKANLRGTPGGYTRLGTTVRFYDSEGYALLDLDEHPGHEDKGKPHAHWWEWSSDRQLADRGEPTEAPEGTEEIGKDENGNPIYEPFGYISITPSGQTFPSGVRPSARPAPVRPSMPLRFPIRIPVLP